MRVLTDPTPIPMFDSSRAFVFSAIFSTLVGFSAWSFLAPAMLPDRLFVLPLLLAILILLYATRRSRWHERVAAWIFVSTTVILIGLIWMNHENYIRSNLPFQPFIGLKVISIFLPMFCPRLRWVGWTAVALLVVAPIAQYFSWTPELQSMLGIQEPWLTAVFAFICGVIYQMRLFLAEHTQLVQRHADRAQLMEKVASLLLGAGHLINTPLQTIEATFALAEIRNPLLAGSVERSFATVRRVTDSLSFIEAYTNWKTLELPENCSELERRVREFRRAVENVRDPISVEVSHRDIHSDVSP